MYTSTANVQLALLEKKIDETIQDMSPMYPFLVLGRSLSKKQRDEDDQRSDELALRTIREISESLTV